MKKRVLSILLSLVMVIGLLPTTALAGGGTVEGGSTWESFKQAAAQNISTALSKDGYTFAWPTEADTLTIARPISIGYGGWTVPANITLAFSGTTHGFLQCTNYYGGTIDLVLNGPVTYSNGNWLDLATTVGTDAKANVTINGACNVDGTTVIRSDCTMTIGATGSIGAVQLGGTLTGDGVTLNKQVIVNTLYGSSEDTSAVLSGTLTLADGLYCDRRGGVDDIGSNLSIPIGSQITLSAWSNSVGQKNTVSLDGTLNVKNNLMLGGTLALGENGVLKLDGNNVCVSSYSVWLDNEGQTYTGQITGSGTIQYTSDDQTIFGTAIAEIIGDRDTYANTVATTVKFEKIGGTGGSTGGDSSNPGGGDNTDDPGGGTGGGDNTDNPGTGGSEGGGSTITPSQTLTAPSAPVWGKYWEDIWDDATGEVTQRALDMPGMISWTNAANSEDCLIEVKVYKEGDSEEVYCSYWEVLAKDEDHKSDWDFALSGLGGLTEGNYYFTLQARDYNLWSAPTKVSEIVKSGMWEYKNPTAKLFAPNNVTVGTNGSLSWSPVTNAGGYCVDTYFSQTQVTDFDAALRDNTLNRVNGFVWYLGEHWVTDDNATTYVDTWSLEENGAGYYYYTVQTVSADVNTQQHSEPTALSTTLCYYYDGHKLDEESCEHNSTELVGQKSATCTEAGYTGDRVCNSCGQAVVQGETIPAAGHTEVIAPAVAATCTEVGKTEGKHCSVCSAVLTAQTEVAALGHDWDKGVVTKEPTAEAAGVKTFTCKRKGCGATKTETIPALNPQQVSWAVSSMDMIWGQFNNSVSNSAANDTTDGGALTYTSSNADVATVDNEGQVTVKGTGSAIITATAAAVPGKYAETSASFTLTVNKAELTVTAKNHTISYGKIPANDGYNVSDLVAGDTEAVLTGTAAYSYGEYEQYQGVGTYEISVSGLSAKNYNITFAEGTLTVNKATAYTISLGKLEQVAGHTSAVTARVEPYDATAKIKVEYKDGDQWTEAVPTGVGNYPVRASLTASDNIAVPTEIAYTTGTLVVKSGVTVDTGKDDSNATASVTVTDGKATLEIEKPDEIAKQADGDVSIDLGGVKNAKELELPGGLMTGLSENEKAGSLTVTTEDAKVTLSETVLDTVADAVKSDKDTVTVRLTAVETTDLNDKQQAALNAITRDAVIVEVSLVVSHENGELTELHRLGGRADITVPYDGPVPAGKHIVVSYVSSDGGVSYVRATYDKETKQVSFSTNHFSHYALFLSNTDTHDVTVTDGSGSGTYLEGSTVTVKADSKSGYRFTGWSIVSGSVTLADANKAETTFTMPAGDVNLKANYSRDSSGGGGGSFAATYSISVEKAEHGTVSVSPKSASKGVTVTITAKPDAGYVVGQIIVTDKNGNAVEVIKNDDGTFSFKQPASTVTIKVAYTPVDAGFTDVPADAYYAEAVNWAAAEGITGGIGSGQFAPDLACTRAQIVTFLWRAAGSPAPKTVRVFSDVPADAYYAQAVYWAAENGITGGVGDNKFAPDLPCTRAQAVTFLFRYAASQGMDAVTLQELVSGYDDAEQVPSYALSAFNWALANGVMQGYSNQLMPNNDCTRAQIVTFLYRSRQ